MELHENRPCTLLSAFVERFWYVEASAEESSVIPDAILPNGTSNLIFNLSECPHREYDDESFANFRSLNGVWLSGIRDSALIVGPTVRTRVVGVRFKPGGLSVFTKLPSVEVARLTIDPGDLWGSDCQRLHERLFDTMSIARQFELMEDWLLARFDCDATHVGLLNSLRLLDATSGNVSVTRLASATDMSPRQYRRRFEQDVGITPKKMARVLRFRNLVTRIIPTARVDWAGAAFECGYFDQAHLIMDFRDFAGVSPGEYLRRRPQVPGFMPLEAPVTVFSNTPEANSDRMAAN